MASTTRIAALKAALADLLIAKTGAGGALEGVVVASAEVPTLRTHETIELMGEDLIEQEWAAIGKLARDEEITLNGLVFVRKPGPPSEAVIRAARDRAVALVAVIEDTLTGTGGDPTVSNTVKAARCRPAELAEFADPEGRIAMIRFEIKTQLTRLVRA